MNLRDQPWRLEDARKLVQNGHLQLQTFSKNLLDVNNPFLVPSLYKLNHISVCFIQISTKSPANSLFPSGNPANICWSSRCLEEVFKTCLEDVFNTSSAQRFYVFQDVLKASWRRFQDLSQDVLKTSWKTKNCYAEDIFKTSRRHVLKTSWRQTKCLLMISVSNKSKRVCNKSMFHKSMPDKSKANQKCVT